MCRLFGFRSTIQSQVHRSLVDADKGLGQLSSEHKDGWGVAYYVDSAPHVTRSPETALGDQIFHRVSGVVASETVIAHVRRATVGAVNVLNCHPFQHGRWTFAHNGEIHDFDGHRDKLCGEVAPRLRRFILGDTDSEVLFMLFLTHLSRFGALSSRFDIDEIIEGLRETTAQVRELCDTPDKPAALTFMLTDGTAMVAVQGGKELRWSTHKTRCADRDSCPNLAQNCEAPTDNGSVNHLILSSEQFAGENVWHTMEPGEIIGVDWRMRLTRGHL